MNNPRGVCRDALGNIWVADTSNNRVLKFNTILASAVAPAAYANIGPVSVDITGQEFVNGMTLRLRKAGQEDVVATNVNVLESGHLTCTFDLAFRTTGYWDIVVSSGGPGSLTTVFAHSFEVTLPPTAAGDAYSADDSSVTLHADYGDIVVTVPAGAFSETTAVTVAEANVPPSDRPALTRSGINIAVSASGGRQPAKAVTITIHYRDSDVIGIDPAKLVLAWYDDAHSRWVTLPSRSDPGQNMLVGTARRFGKFAVVQLTPLDNLKTVKAYPSPFNPNRCAFMTIDNLTTTATIRIYTIAGELVREIEYTNETGRAIWDGRNDAGNRVASGIYLMFIDSPRGTEILKVAVEK
jgi:hypothetical protein